jgi:hypothetical protein
MADQRFTPGTGGAFRPDADYDISGDWRFERPLALSTGSDDEPALIFSSELTFGLFRKSAGKVIFRNGADQDAYWGFQSGDTAEQRAYLAWYDRLGSTQPKWLMGKNAIDNFVLYEASSTVHVFTHYANGASELNSSNATPVRINYHQLNAVAQTGTGGLEVYSGTATPALLGSLTAGGITAGVTTGKGVFSAVAQTVADGGTIYLGPSASTIGYLFITASGNERGFYTINGVSNATAEINDFSNLFTNTKNTAASINIYYDAAGGSGAGYYVQNLRGASRDIRLMLIG